MLLRKNHIQILLQALVVILALVSCTDDDFVGNRGSSNNGTPHYLAIKLKMDSNSSTRAGERFDNGTADDHIMGPSGNIAILFKGSELFGIYDLDKRNSENNDEDTEAQYLYIQQLPVDKEVDFPTSCLVVLNGSNDICNDLNEKTTVNDVLNYIWKADPENIGYADTNHQYFTMSNSMYNGSGATPFKAEDHIFQTKDSAAMFPIIVPIERVVAKVQLEENVGSEDNSKAKAVGDRIYELYNDNIKDIIVHCTFGSDGELSEPTYSEKNYQIKLTGWNVNALETESNLFKKVNKEYFSGSDDLSNRHRRSYWGEDPHYDKAANGANLKYPWQYRLAVNNPLDFYKEKYPTLESDNTNYLKNYSYTELNDGNFGEDRIEYIPENTYDPSIYNMETDFDSRTNLLAGTHLIVCAELLTDLENNRDFQPKDVYRDRKGVYYKNPKDCFWALVRAFNYNLQSETQMKFTYYKWNVDKGGDGEKRSALTTQIDYQIYNKPLSEWNDAMTKYNSTKNNNDYPKPTGSGEGRKYMLYHNDTPVTYDYVMSLDEDMFIDATIKDGDGKVLPWLDGLTIKTVDGEHVKIYDKITVKYDLKGERVIVGTELTIPDSDWDDITKSMILEWMGAVDYFKDGKMYYSIPILHNGANKSDQDQKTLGDYGVVRNSWYKFKLTDIINIGTSVNKPEEPIVPNKVKTNDQLNVTIDIIDWHPIELPAPF